MSRVAARRTVNRQDANEFIDKCSEAEHKGNRRLFIGCSTGRGSPDYPRGKYRSFRKELRRVLLAERTRPTLQRLTAEKELNSLEDRIAYVARLNAREARSLEEIFFRICAARRRDARAVA